MQRTSILSLTGLLILFAALFGALSAADSPDKGSALEAELGSLRRQRFELAAASFERLVKDYTGSRNGDMLCAAAERLAESEVALSNDPAKQVAALERHLGRLTMLKTREKIAFQAGRIPVADILRTFDFTIDDAEVRLFEARQRLAPR